METAKIVFEHSFDESMFEQIRELRTMRLGVAERMLRNLASTNESIRSKGYASDFSKDELRQELLSHISSLRSRMEDPHVIYADELDMYVQLLAENVSV